MLSENKFRFALVIVGIAAGALAGCSSSKTTEGLTSVDDPAPITDAGTDAVPQASAENVPPPADLGVPPADPNAPAPDLVAGDPGTPPPIEAVPPPVDAPPPAPESSEISNLMTAPPPAPPAETPAAPESSTASAPVQGDDIESYTVQEGETLMRIAFEVYGDLYKWRSIYEMNRDKVSNPSAIPAGTVLQLEKPSESVRVSRNGEKYLIKHGDTLGTISEDVYGTKQKWKKLWKNNRELIKDPNRIFAGFHLYYTMSPDDRRELEQLRNGGAPEVQQQPLASGATPENAAGAPTPEVPRQPASAGPEVPGSVAPAAQ